MDTKLTLTVEQSVIEQAKLYAQRQGQSLSDIVENYLKVLISEKLEEEELSPLVKSLRGSFTMPAGFDEKKELELRLREKYL